MERKPSKDELAGMCWWNALSERDREKWLKQAESAVPADAWESFKSKIVRDVATDSVFVHITPNPDACEHDFQGWTEFEDGSGGEQVCTKCGMGAMTYSLRTGF